MNEWIDGFMNEWTNEKIKNITFFQFKKNETDLHTLRENNKSITALKDSLLGEKTALKNEVGIQTFRISTN